MCLATRNDPQGAEQGMNYKTIMVSLALDKPNDACLAVAGDLAERFEARVIGIAASDLRPPLYFEEGEYARNLIRREEGAIRRRLLELEAEFRGSVQKRAKSVEWRSSLAMPANYLVQQSRAADLLVVGARTETIVDLSAAVDPADVLMRAGRPLVVVPSTAQWLDLRSVLVAWKDVKEARRAVLDALPVLATAKDVTIAEIPEEASARVNALSHVEDVAAWLRGHGIAASVVTSEPTADVPGQLDWIAANAGAGMVIAGAYGHSRLREWALGGVTRHLMTSISLCYPFALSEQQRSG
jgi:nucleotide-binding universal stress UspA family protein